MALRSIATDDIRPGHQRHCRRPMIDFIPSRWRETVFKQPVWRGEAAPGDVCRLALLQRGNGRIGALGRPQTPAIGRPQTPAPGRRRHRQAQTSALSRRRHRHSAGADIDHGADIGILGRRRHRHSAGADIGTRQAQTSTIDRRRHRRSRPWRTDSGPAGSKIAIG